MSKGKGSILQEQEVFAAGYDHWDKAIYLKASTQSSYSFLTFTIEEAEQAIAILKRAVKKARRDEGKNK